MLKKKPEFTGHLVCVCLCVYIFIYILREREREGKRRRLILPAELMHHNFIFLVVQSNLIDLQLFPKEDKGQNEIIILAMSKRQTFK